MVAYLGHEVEVGMRNGDKKIKFRNKEIKEICLEYSSDDDIM